MCLRVYVEADSLLWTDKDEGEPIALDDFELAAGTYIVEVGTSGDGDSSPYSLLVSLEE
jgi:hypothetical protein